VPRKAQPKDRRPYPFNAHCVRTFCSRGIGNPIVSEAPFPPTLGRCDRRVRTQARDGSGYCQFLRFGSIQGEAQHMQVSPQKYFFAPVSPLIQ
jgi:hypothetical protein